MVLGIGEGKIDVFLDKNTFSNGETIRGRLKLDISKPKKAKELRIELRAERTVSGGRGKRRNEIVYSFVLRLDGEHEYNGIKDYNFEVSVPKMEAKAKPTGILGAFADVTQFLGLGASPVRWYIQASLNMSWAFDITKKIQINVV